MDFENYIASRIDLYKSSTLPTFSKKVAKEFDDAGICSTANEAERLSAAVGRSMAIAFEIAISEIEAYHQMLLDNFQIVPKK